jgi:hypothetical protein
MASLFLSAHETAVLVREPGPPLEIMWANPRVLASVVATWAITHDAPGVYPRWAAVPGDEEARIMEIGGTETPLLSDMELWSLLGRTGQPPIQFSRGLDGEQLGLYGRTCALAEAVVALRREVVQAAKMRAVSGPVEQLCVAGVARAGQQMLPGFLAVVLGDCLPRGVEDRPRGWTRHTESVYRVVADMVANSSAPPGTYTVRQLLRFRGPNVTRGLNSVVGSADARSGRFVLPPPAPLPEQEDVPSLNGLVEEGDGSSLEERFPLLWDTVNDLSDLAARVLEATADRQEADAASRLDFAGRMAAVEARLPGPGSLVTEAELDHATTLAWRLYDRCSDQIRALADQLSSLAQRAGPASAGPATADPAAPRATLPSGP